MRGRWFNSKAAMLILVGCADPSVSTSRSGLEEDTMQEVGDAIEEYQAAWEGGSRPGAEVWRPEPSEPSGFPTPTFGFVDRLAAAEPATSVVVKATINKIEYEFWEKPPPSSGWVGDSVVTVLHLAIEETICGQVDRPAVVAYFRGGRLGDRTDRPIDQPDVAVGHSYGFWLQGQDSYYLRAGGLDLLHPQPTGTFLAYGGVELALSTIKGACP